MSTLSTITPGDRIRMVTFAVTASDDTIRRVNVKYLWTGGTPEHSCNPTTCDFCESQVQQIVGRHLSRDGLSVTSMVAIRDRQMTATEPPARHRQTVAA